MANVKDVKSSKNFAGRLCPLAPYVAHHLDRLWAQEIEERWRTKEVEKERRVVSKKEKIH